MSAFTRFLRRKATRTHPPLSARLRLRSVFAALSIAAVSCLSLTSAYAFLSSQDDAANAFTVSSTSIEINEDFPDSPPIIEQGSVTKVVSIENTGTGACFVRAIVELSDSSASAYASFDVNDEAWTEKKPDGYHYYREALPVGAITEPLITSVDISEKPAEGYQSFDVIVHAEGAQATDPATGQLYPDGPAAFAARTAET